VIYAALSVVLGGYPAAFFLLVMTVLNLPELSPF
jgi:hypothetical protein